MLVRAILLTDGLGTRLRSVVNDRPKPMALVEGKPFMEYTARELARHGITDIVLAMGYKGTVVEEHFGGGAAFGFHANYTYEGMPLSTAGAIKNTGRSITEDRSYVLNGSTFYQINYTRLLKQQDSQNLDVALVLCSVPDISRYGQAVLDHDGFLIGFNEKVEDAREGMISGGVYLMEQRLLDEIPEGEMSLENDMIPRWLLEGRCLGGSVNNGYFTNIGVPEAYFQFQKDVRNKAVI